jgi:TolA-binding protein
MTMRSLFPVSLGLAIVACGGPLAQGESQFNKGRYPEAKQTFASIEDESRSYADPKRAEYALYRGLTLAALGDHAQAATWLREAKAIEDTHPDSLSHEDVQRLKEAMAAGEAP